MVSLADLVRLERRPVPVLADQDYPEIGIYCFGKGIFHKRPRSGLEVGDKALCQLRRGDLILQITFAWEGAVALCGPEEDGLYASTRYPTFRVDEERCDPKFLCRYLSTPSGREQLVRISPGSAGRNRVLALKRLGEVHIPLPSLAEQRRIVDRIEALAGEIDEARRLRSDSVHETAALQSRMAVEVLNRVATKHSTRRLRELVTTKGGGTPSKSNPLYWDGSIPWISPKDMKRRELFDSIDHVSEAATKETASKQIDPGAVLVVVRGMILAHTFPTAVLRVPAAINQDMKALVPHGEIAPEYLCCVFWAWNSRMLDLVEKSTHDTRKLQTDKLLNAEIPVPPLALQHGIVAELIALQAEVDALKRLQSETAAELDALLPAILDRAFKGEL